MSEFTVVLNAEQINQPHKPMRNLLGIAACLLLFPASLSAQSASEAKVWSLQDCIDYAVANNVTLLKSRATEESNAVDVLEAKAGWLPSLNASVSQNLTYRPFQETGASYVNGGITSSAADKATESGSYGVSASWTVWNGGRTKMNITNAEFTEQIAGLNTAASENTIKEQIAQYYTQILYMTEAEKVNAELLRQDSTICARGEEMVAVGSMARADLAQLKAQVSQGVYDLVNIQTQIAEAKLQLKQLLEIPGSESFEVQSVDVAESQVLSVIPSKETVYESALATRPEIQSAKLAIEQSALATKIARSNYYPTVSLSGSLGDSHVTGSENSFFNQMKQNFNFGVGVSVSIPIFDNRSTKSSVERAKIAETTAQLDLQDNQKQLYQTIETYWLNATNSQAKYVAAVSNVASLQESYDLMREQFNVGLKNIAELLNARESLLSAEQTMLEDKYTAYLNRNLLNFYAGEDFK